MRNLKRLVNELIEMGSVHKHLASYSLTILKLLGVSVTIIDPYKLRLYFNGVVFTFFLK